LEFPARAIRQEEEIKGTQTGKEEVTNEMIVQLKDLKNSIKKQDTTNSFSKVAGCKINLQNPVAFLYTNNAQTEKEYKKTFHLQ
jgi:hypothetical protein